MHFLYASDYTLTDAIILTVYNNNQGFGKLTHTNIHYNYQVEYQLFTTVIKGLGILSRHEVVSCVQAHNTPFNNTLPYMDVNT